MEGLFIGYPDVFSYNNKVFRLGLDKGNETFYIFFFLCIIACFVRGFNEPIKFEIKITVNGFY